MCEIPKTRIKLAVQGLFHVLRPCPKTLPGRPRPKRRTDTTGTDWSCFSRCCTHFGDNMPLRIFRFPSRHISFPVTQQQEQRPCCTKRELAAPPAPGDVATTLR